MDRHMELEIVDDNELNTGCQDNVNTGEHYANLCQEILDRLTKFPHMWYGRLGSIGKAKFCI